MKYVFSMVVIWIWLAIDRDTGEIVGMAIGDRSYQTAQQLLRQAQHKYGIRYLVCIANVR